MQACSSPVIKRRDGTISHPNFLWPENYRPAATSVYIDDIICHQIFKIEPIFIVYAMHFWFAKNFLQMCLEVHEPHMFLSRTLKGASVSLYKKMTHEMFKIYQYIYMYLVNKKSKFIKYQAHYSTRKPKNIFECHFGRNIHNSNLWLVYCIDNIKDLCLLLERTRILQ